jgi:hypothetical protein
MARALTTVLALILLAAPASGQEPADTAAIRQAALDYIEGWYSGDGERMSSALHPQLVKRIVQSRAGVDSRLSAMTAAELIAATRGRAGGAGGEEGRKDVRILDVFGSAASVRIDATDWVDYLHLARWNGEWKIVNVLWELR